ncbi:MAG: phosphohistidine phosphatase SixA [Mariprofundus sp.]|nr:phosphohistidine phosphatase SixA [Mariprofundus sp.]
MRLYMVQHGLALDASEDATRPLSAQGLNDVTRTAGFLSLFEKPQPKIIMHSEKLRAKQTAEMFAEAWGGIKMGQTPELESHADPAYWLTQLAMMADDLLLVGHLPHLQRLAGLLLCGDTERTPIRFRNAGVVCIDYQSSGCSILWQINPTLFYGEES